jgi:hypothetical protein
MESKDSCQSIFSNWDRVKHGVLGSMLGPLLFPFYINDVPKIIKINSKPLLFADDTSLIIINLIPINFRVDITTAFVQRNEWFNANLLFLHYEKIYYIHFMAKSSYWLQ